MKKILLTAILFISCSITNKITQQQLNNILDNTITSLYQEKDLELGKYAILSNLKLLEGLSITYKDNDLYNTLLSQAYFSYSIGFIEDYDKKRAVEFYIKGRKFAEKVFKIDLDHISIDSLKQFLDNVPKEKLPAVFWAAFNWSAQIFLQVDKPESYANLAKVQLLMNFVKENNDKYFYGACYVFWGSYYSTLPPMFGGDYNQSKEYFQKAFDISGGNILLFYYYYMKTYCINTMDEDEFENTYKKIINFDLSKFPEQRLANVIAIKKSQLLYKQKDDIF